MDTRDQLSEIAGIGPARARWLEETFGVRTFRDLAALSPDEIERKLKAVGRQAVSRATIESWIDEAATRAPERAKPGAPRKRGRGDRAGSEASVWKPVASFVVEFQSGPAEGAEKAWRTAVHYLEEDRNETWAAIDCDRLCRWMTRQLGRAEGREPTEEAAPQAASRFDLTRRSTRPAEALRAYVVDGDGVERANLIRIDKPWAIVFTWPPVEGVAEGEWQLDVLLRRVGPGEQLRLRAGPTRLPAKVPRIDGGYRYRFEVAAEIVTAAHVDTLYRASATLMYAPAKGERILPFGFVDLGLLRFYEPIRSRAEPPLVAAVEEP